MKASDSISMADLHLPPEERIKKEKLCVPFKNYLWKLKQLEKEKAIVGRVVPKGLKAMTQGEKNHQEEGEHVRGSYRSYEAGLSIKNPAKYCDLSGFVARYTDPKTGMRYCWAWQLEEIRKMHDDTIQNILAYRKGGTKLT